MCSEGTTTLFFLFFYSAHATRPQHSQSIAIAVSMQLMQQTNIIWQTSLFSLGLTLSRPVSLINLCYHLKGIHVKVFKRSMFLQIHTQLTFELILLEKCHLPVGSGKSSLGQAGVVPQGAEKDLFRFNLLVCQRKSSREIYHSIAAVCMKKTIHQPWPWV